MISDDYFDLEVDRINHPQRPLPSGRVSVSELAVLTGLFSAAGFIASALLGLFLWLFLWSYGLLACFITGNSRSRDFPEI
jgi:geranylgeranylglycerol-phosphate geranylgeranyltransferase